MKLLNIGFGNMVSAERLIAVVTCCLPGSEQPDSRHSPASAAASARFFQLIQRFLTGI